MYNEQIEELISATLADGVLTEKEKQVLFKKAQAQGIDLDELEVVLDGRLAEMKKAETSAPKSNKLGDVKKCPACGAIVQSYLGSCPDCGYAFEGIEANLTSKIMSEKLEQIQKEADSKISGKNNKELRDDDIWLIKKQMVETKAQIITSTSIPTTKADLFEFLTATQVQMLSPQAHKKIAASYNLKYNEALLKASALFSQDTMFNKLIANKQNVLKEYKSVHKKQSGDGLKPSSKGAIIGMSILLGILASCVIGLIFIM